MGKKVIALLVALVMILPQMGSMDLFAASIGTEAGACKELGILIGADASGVTTEYLATTPTRIQAFIIVLRLKGLYSEATEYEGYDNFSDASASGWAKNYMAYAKSHPNLGWGGYPNGTFAPADKINGQAFYKVMLETLGYKQDIDFTYADTLKFAQSIGLVKKAEDISKLGNFTVDAVAKGIYSALNTKPKNSDKKLITVMVEQDIITSQKAVAAGFTLDTKDAKIISFDAVSNNRIELEFDQTILLQKADVDISQVGGSSRLSILSVESQGKTATIITTEANPFSAYELTINTLVPTTNLVVKNYKKKFVAMPKDVTKPTVKHEITGRNEILLTFSEEVSRETAENLSNYMVENDVAVLSAELTESRKAVRLRTTNMLSTDFYRLTVQNVCDTAGNSIDRYKVPFDGAQKDLRNPSVVSVRSENSTTLTVTFDERVDKITAESMDNYYIDNGVSVTNAKLDDTGKAVTISTTEQQSGTIYNLTVQNVSDSWGNIMYRKDYRFVGDSTKPTATIMAVSNNEVLITFSKKVSRESAENASNYVIDKGLTVKEAVLDDSGKVVTLITSGQTLRELYTVTVMQVYDLWGNMISIYTGKFGGMQADTRKLAYTAKSDGNQIILTFNKRLDKSTAEDNFNYVLDKELGYAAKATLDSTGRIVTLLTANHSNGKMYSVTVENVEDIFGEVISSDSNVCTKKFVGISSSSGSSTGTLNLETVVTVNVNTVDLIFSAELTEDELEDMRVKVRVPEEYSHTMPASLTSYIYFVGDKRNVRVQYETDSSKNPDLFKSGNVYEVVVTGIDRLNSKNSANIKMFAGTGTPNTAPEVLSVVALNSTAVEVAFSEPVKGITKNQFDIKNSINISDISVKSSTEITDKVTLYLSSSTKLYDSVYKLYVRTGVKDAAGLNAVNVGTGSSNNYIEFDGLSYDNEAPYVDTDITVVDTYTLQFAFNEPIKSVSTSSFSIKRTSSGSGSSNVIIANAKLADDKQTVTLYLNSGYAALDSDHEYELTINSSVADMQSLTVASENRKLQFSGVDNDPEDLEVVASYINEDNDKITLMFSRELNISGLSTSDFEFSGAGYYKSSSDEVKYDEKSVTISLKNELDNGETLTIKITSGGRSRIKDYNNQKLITEELEIETN
ncbi:MAG: hypothetical protein APF77_19540 [Clostridia bacterium BRH_c25]|nr:MAG: hypothetical protein APF77_19540 [Clostridia bacterium BRH_c25]